MADFIGKEVMHKTFGKGIVVGFDGKYIKVEFAGKIGEYGYPSAFENGFLSILNEQCLAKINDDIALLNKAKAEKERRKEEEREAAEQRRIAEQAARTRGPRQNIAFKCNFCNGGESASNVGFCGVCSDEIIKNNIENRKYTECCREVNLCNQYYHGKIDRATLDSSYTCYESRMLIDWKASAGVSTDGKPERIVNAQINSLCIFTTRDPGDSSEADRYIFGAFIIDDIFEGDELHEGYVRASAESPYKISLTKDEAHKVKFWDFYHNRNKPEKLYWGQGLFRYLTTQNNPKKPQDDIAVSILKAIIDVKSGKPDEQKAKDLLDHFRKINGIK